MNQLMYHELFNRVVASTLRLDADGVVLKDRLIDIAKNGVRFRAIKRRRKSCKTLLTNGA